MVQHFYGHLEFRRQNRLELGRIDRKLKPLYVATGQREKGKGWEAFLEARGGGMAFIGAGFNNDLITSGSPLIQGLLAEAVSVSD